MSARKLVAVVLVATLPAALAACGGSGPPTRTVTIVGAGSTFATSIYRQWAIDLADYGIRLRYSSVAPGAGLALLRARTVGFGATDVISARDVASAPHLIHVPTALGAIALTYNVPGVERSLRLDGPTLASIFLGRIRRWSDPAIAALNPGIGLPSIPFAVVRRADATIATRSLTSFLTRASLRWRQQIGTGDVVKWPIGIGAIGDAGVATAIARTAGAIGYVEQGYALTNGLRYAWIRNKAGNFVAPTIPAAVAAANQLEPLPDLRFTVSNLANPAAYPIVSPSFIVVEPDLCRSGLSVKAAKALVTFLDYGLGGGQIVVEQFGYSPLPSTVLSAAQTAVAALACNGALIK